MAEGVRCGACAAVTLPTEDEPLPFRGRTGVTRLSLRFKTATMVEILFTGLILYRGWSICLSVYLYAYIDGNVTVKAAFPIIISINSTVKHQTHKSW